MTSLKLIARLTDSGGTPLSGKTIYFYASGDGSTWSLLTSVITDNGGYASVTYDANQKTWFKAEFKGDEQYDPASDTAVWEPSTQPPPQPSPACPPLFRTGVSWLDQVLFCVGGYGVSVAVLMAAITLLILLISR